MRNFLLYIFILSVSLLSAQNISFTAEPSRKTLGENERVQVNFIMNENGDNFIPPSFKDFDATGPIESNSYSWINGVKSFSKTYTYTLRPLKKGKLTIGAASIIINGKEYKTKPFSLEVTEAVSNPHQAQTIPPTSNNPFNNFPFGGFPFGMDPFSPEEQQPTEAIEPTKEQLFIVAEVSKKQVYVNEPISVTYKLYIAPQFGIREYEKIEIPRYQNFWNQQLSSKFQMAEVIHNNKPYRCITLKQVLLYPQQAGEQTIDPLSISFILQLPINKIDRFGNRFYTTRSRTLETVSTKIKVLPLPEEGKPADFSGAVGDFSLSVQFPTQRLNAGETSVGDVVIAGKGNFKLFDIPKLSFPAALEAYAPTEKEHLNSTPSGIVGDITHTYTLIPQYKGKYPITPIHFSFFNPNTGKYQTLTSEEFNIEVINGELYSANPNENTPDNPYLESQDFQGLKLDADLSSMASRSFFGSVTFFLCWLLPLLIIPIVILSWYFYEKRNDNSPENRIRRSNRLAKKYLSVAKKNLSDKEAFYESLEKGLHTYLKAKLRIETTELNKEKIQELLSLKGVENPLIESFLKIISNCELARYAPYTQADINNDYEQAVETISLLDKQL